MADNFRAAIDDKTDLIVANSFDSVDAITKLGKQFPDQKWAVVDTTVDNPNVRWSSRARGHVPDRRHLRLLATGNYPPYPKSDVIGAVGAIDQPFIRRWLVGFQEGVKAVNPNAKLIDGFGNSFNDPATSKELARAVQPGCQRLVLVRQHRHLRGRQGEELLHVGRRYRSAPHRPGAHPRVDGQANGPRRTTRSRSGQGPVQGRNRRLRPASGASARHSSRSTTSTASALPPEVQDSQGTGGRHRQAIVVTITITPSHSRALSAAKPSAVTQRSY